MRLIDWLCLILFAIGYLKKLSEKVSVFHLKTCFSDNFFTLEVVESATVTVFQKSYLKGLSENG